MKEIMLQEINNAVHLKEWLQSENFSVESCPQNAISDLSKSLETVEGKGRFAIMDLFRLLALDDKLVAGILAN